ncbi:HpcH/HpaI aldolase/citrate lyase family protein [Paenibacillus lautus]|uniref:HpcH/HpaI aldolase/citrate lyase family protein n=1 Tax=Paenibacillus lautus TaxID=1401 RepID=UPI003D27E6BE
MRYFNYLQGNEDFFFKSPQPFTNKSSKEIIAHAVGAALYMPATRPNIANELVSGKIQGLVTAVIDLEDAVGDNQLEVAEKNLCVQLYRILKLKKQGVITEEDIPLIFVRVRTPEQMKRIIAVLEETIEVITGFTLPKFSLVNGQQFLSLIHGYNQGKSSCAPTLYAMPILETSDVIYRETRMQTLLDIKDLLNCYKEYVLNVRIGATDFSSLFGLRRNPDMTIYDIGVIRDCIADIINVFGRFDDPYVISGPVWEYFKSDRVLKPQLRQTPFEEAAGKQGRLIRMDYINMYVDGLIRETVLDKENGIIGKTIIHPSHLLPVQSMYVVTHEEYIDAMNIIANNDGSFGVLKSQYENKMIEIKPHLNWAKRIILRSQIYGVLHENQNYTTLLIETRGFEQTQAHV